MADTDKKFLDDDGVSQFAEETKKYVDNKVSQLDDVYIRNDDTTVVRLRNQNEINLQEDHNNAWFGYRDGKVNNWKFGNGTEGGLADVYANDYYLGDEKLSDTFIRVDDTTIVKLVNDNEINLQEDHTNAWFGYRDGKVTNWKFGDGTEGGLADVYVKDLYLGDQKLSDLLENYYDKTEVDNKFSQLDDVYIRSDDTTIVKLVNDNEINLQEDHTNAWFGYRDGKVTNWKFGNGTEGGLADVYVKDIYLQDISLLRILSEVAYYDDVVHKYGDESVEGRKYYRDLQTNYYGTSYRDSSKDAYILPGTGLIIATASFAQTVKIGNYVVDSKGKPVLDNNGKLILDKEKGYLQISAGLNGTTPSVVIETKRTIDNPNVLSQLGTSTNKWKEVNTEKVNGKTPELIEAQGDGYIRYASGIQICWANVLLHDLVYQAGYSYACNFPKSFIAAPSVTVNYSSAYSTDTGIAAESIGTAGCTIWVKNTKLSVDDFNINYMAIGRWK